MRTTTLFVALLCLTIVSCTQILSDYSAIIGGNVDISAADCEGRLLVGGNAKLTYYGIGTRLAVDCDRLDLQVGGDLLGRYGEISRGRGSVGGNIDVQYWGTPCGAIENAAPVVNIADAMSDLGQDSADIAAQGTTGTIAWNFKDLHLSGTEEYNYFSFPASYLNGMTGLYIDVPSGAWTFVTVEGSAATFTNFQIFLSDSTNIQKVLYNFPTATSLTVSSLSFQGSVLAPYASVSYTNGNIEGSIACLNFNGNGEFHYLPYVPPESDCDEVCEPCNNYITVPSTNFYSLFIHHNLVSSGTDFEGRVAVGGDATLNFIGIGDKLTPSGGNRDDLQVTGDLFYHDGEVFNGNIVVYGSYDIERVGTPQGSVKNTHVWIPWDVDFLGLHAVSIFLSSWFSNGHDSVSYSTLNLYGSGFHLNTFRISSTQLANARTIVISVPPSSHVIINVMADDEIVYFQNTGTILNGAHPSRILWNFVDTKVLEMSSVEIQGSILAPVTDVVFNNGQLKGAIFASSYTGNGEIHIASWVPLPVPCNPCQC